jgi:uncharacterized phage protein (TIGR01671 family)
MNRFKFRAWDVIHKKMWINVYPTNESNILLHSVRKTTESHTGEGVHEESYTDTWISLEGSWSESEHPYIFMQFIGLPDKNNKEIYEGDILKFENIHLTRYSVVKWDDKFAKFYQDTHIIFNSGKPKAREKRCVNAGSNSTDKMEIIGNIYENPNLLKELK